MGIVGSLTPIRRDDIQVSDLRLHEEGTRLRNGRLMKGNRGVKVKKEEASMGFCELLDGGYRVLAPSNVTNLPIRL